MLSIFNSKYFLKDLLPNNYIDIHNHLLAGIDDGAKTIAETSTLINSMKGLNINSAIATPHTINKLWDNTTENIKAAFKIATTSELNKTFLKGYASEYRLDSTLMERINKEPLLCIKDSYVLIELPFFHNPIDLYEMLFELKMKNYKIIIAHPERYRYFHNDIKKYIKLKEFGVYFQLNLLSLTGYYGKEIQKITNLLMDNNLYDFTGTDIHNEGHIEQFKTKPIVFSNKNTIRDLLEENKIFL
jgi:tyrosine-protein phosphatase YwqE